MFWKRHRPDARHEPRPCGQRESEDLCGPVVLKPAPVSDTVDLSTEMEFTMQWNPMVPELTVTDFAHSLTFYRDLLCFRVCYTRANPDFAYLEREGVQLMLEAFHPEGWQTGHLDAPLGRGINLQMEFSELLPQLDKLAAADWPLFRPLTESWYSMGETDSGQQEFLVQDPDGYLLRLTRYLGERPAGSTQ